MEKNKEQRIENKQQRIKIRDLTPAFDALFCFVAPLFFVCVFWAAKNPKQLGCSTTPAVTHVPLLPSGPGGVGKCAPRRTQLFGLQGLYQAARRKAKKDERSLIPSAFDGAKPATSLSQR
jgi:hypothetical protein